MTAETTDVLVIGSGFGGAIPAYYLAAAGARVTILERGPRLSAADFTQDLRLGTYTRIVDVIKGDGISVVAGNCVGGGSVIYLAASLRTPSFAFERQAGTGRRQWPAALTRATLDPWYDRAEQALPVTRLTWNDVSYAGGLLAAACHRAGRTCNPVPVAVDLARCTHCNWMLNGCRQDAKRSMLLNYLPAAEAHGADIRPLHEAQAVTPSDVPGYRYAVPYLQLDENDPLCPQGAGRIHCKIVIVAAGAVATPVILRRSAWALPGLPSAVGRHFSGNGDRVSVATVDEDRAATLLGLSRAPGIAYQAMPIGMAITAASFDRLDPTAAEFSRHTLQQIYFPPITALLTQTGANPPWFGVASRDLRSKWPSWITLLAMTEETNDGTFGTPPLTGSFVRLAPGLGLTSLRYRPSARTLSGWQVADADLRDIMGRDGLAQLHPWSADVAGTVTAHPLGSCRIGDDPATSALDHQHELRGCPGIFVTDGSAVPTALTVNPSLTIAALAERAVPAIIERARESGLSLTGGAPVPAAGVG